MALTQSFLPACAAVMLTAGLTASQPQIVQMPTVQPRDGAVKPVGTASIKGRVIDAATGAPVARARVRLGGPGGRPVAITDAGGRFVFADLPAGPYSLMVEKATYAPERYPASGRSLRNSMRPLILQDGQALENLTVPLYRGGVIAGRVVDQHGEPVEQVEVRVLRVSRPGGTGAPMPRGSSQTNDIGEFRVARLEPGAYILQTIPRGAVMEQGPDMAPVVTYYPGVLSQSHAQTIMLERGQSVTDLDLLMLDGTRSVVRGVVLTADGELLTRGGYVNARVVATEPNGGWFAAGSNVRPDGTFHLELTPGDYVLETTIMARSWSGGPPAPGEEQFGTARLTVGEGEISDVRIVLGSPGSLSGRFIFDGTSQPPQESQPMRLHLQSRDSGTCRSGRPEPASGWNFNIVGAVGTCTVVFPGPMGVWIASAVMIGDDDVLDRQITLEPGQQVRDVRVIMTDRQTELTVQVSDEHGQPTREYVALVFSTDRRRWTTGSRHVRTHTPPPVELSALAASLMRSQPGLVPMPRPMRPDTLSGLPPGEYFVAAVDDLEIEESRDRELLERLVNHAVRVTLSDGARAEVQVRKVTRF